MAPPSPDPASEAHERAMREAIREAEQARGTTGDNPWVGSVITDASGVIVAGGHTQGPGEDHAEIVAMHRARARGVDLTTCTVYSTLEPCSFHGRTPACSRAIVDAGVKRLVTGIRDPNPRVDGLGVRSLRDAGVEVIEGVAAREVTLQLAEWIFRHHPHEPLRRASALMLAPGGSRAETIRRLCEYYGLDVARIEPIVDQLGAR
ncbi:MAG TPA: bifunctional diaminohydroxyphosphoribosylaminopyrimidine deaminase/5-amino-6-(5-phosphoribosylamino)uracil reductase RibD [Polyangiales bacterium]|nr:bifunctional diaminohydroxyphosphoribosylaminopyrimidine deaminase/5-amino-6-(5-phosphoribosylamino)uracil reductase RibD [Polyangiales bacterium]